MLLLIMESPTLRAKTRQGKSTVFLPLDKGLPFFLDEVPSTSHREPLQLSYSAHLNLFLEETHVHGISASVRRIAFSSFFHLKNSCQVSSSSENPPPKQAARAFLLFGHRRTKQRIPIRRLCNAYDIRP